MRKEITLYLLSGLFLFCVIAHKNAAYADTAGWFY